MINLVARPVKAPVVKGEGLYEFTLNNARTGLMCRARNARSADEKLAFVFMYQFENNPTVLDFRIGDFKEKNNEDDAERSVPDGPERSEGVRAGD